MMRTAGMIVFCLCAACGRPPLSDEPIPVGRDSVARFVEVGPGDECASGGQRLEAGVDVDGDGKLSDDEVQTSALFCHGAPGATAAPDLMRLRPGVLPACGDAPGVLVEIGRDADGDLALDDDEVRDSGAICDGPAGVAGGAALVDVSDAASCADGGRLVRVGLDGDGDGVLSDGEVLTSRALCNGASTLDAGPAGSAGAAPLVEVVAEELECDAGGQRVRIGRDADGDLALDDEEVSESVVLCHGVEGQAGAPGPGSGESEGTSDAPVALDVSRFGELSGAHVGSVAGNGRSSYAFETRVDHGVMPYTIALFEVESALVVSVREQGGAAALVEVRCRDEIVDERLARVCGTAPLTPGTAYLVTVREPANVANVYALTVSAGAPQGSAVAPVELDATGLSTTDVVVDGSVGEGLESYYRFTPPSRDHFTVSIESVDAPGGDPELAAKLYAGEVREDRLLTSCAALPCVTRRLSGGAPVVLVLDGGAPRAAAFDLRVSAGDDVTPILPLGVRTPAAPIMQLVPAVSGGYALYLAGREFRIAEDLDADVSWDACLGHGGDSCYFELDAGTRYYLFASTLLDSSVAFAQVSAGQEGSLEQPVTLTVDVPRTCSTTHESYGDNGSVPAESYYAFTTTSPGPHAITFSSEQPSLYVDDPVLHGDALFGSPLAVVATGYQNASRVYVTEPLAAGASYFLVFRAYDAVVLSMTVTTGDVATPSLPLDGTLRRTAVDGLDRTWFRITLDAPSVVELQASELDGSLTFRTVLDVPTGATFKSASLSSDGTVRMVLPAGTTYLQLLTISAQQIELGASLVPTPTLEPGAPQRHEGLSGGASDWYRLENDVERVRQLTITNDTSGGGTFLSTVRVYDASAVPIVEEATFNSEVVPLLDATTPLPAGSFLVQVENIDTGFLDYEVQVDAP